MTAVEAIGNWWFSRAIRRRQVSSFFFKCFQGIPTFVLAIRTYATEGKPNSDSIVYNCNHNC